MVSVPSAVASAVTVAVKVAFPNAVRVALPDKSPARVIVGDLLMVTELAISPPLISKLPPSISLLSKAPDLSLFLKLSLVATLALFPTSALRTLSSAAC